MAPNHAAVDFVIFPMASWLPGSLFFLLQVAIVSFCTSDNLSTGLLNELFGASAKVAPNHVPVDFVICFLSVLATSGKRSSSKSENLSTGLLNELFGSSAKVVPRHVARPLLAVVGVLRVKNPQDSVSPVSSPLHPPFLFTSHAKPLRPADY